MDRVLRHIEDYDLGGGEIQSMLKGVATIKSYDKLRGATVQSFFSEAPAVALLFPTKNLQFGHWIALWVEHARRVIHHFDSYGFAPSEEQKFSDLPIVREKLLATFYSQAAAEGYQVHFNPTAFQKMSSGVNTCGRHIICRLRLRYLVDTQYTQLMNHESMSPDELVTAMTFLALNEDAKDKAQVMKIIPAKGGAHAGDDDD